MRHHRKTAAFLGLLMAFLLVGQAFAQERIVGRALYEKLQREGRRMMGGPGGPMGGGVQWTPDGKATGKRAPNPKARRNPRLKSIPFIRLSLQRPRQSARPIIRRRVRPDGRAGPGGGSVGKKKGGRADVSFCPEGV